MTRRPIHLPRNEYFFRAQLIECRSLRISLAYFNEKQKVHSILPPVIAGHLPPLIIFTFTRTALCRL